MEAFRENFKYIILLLGVLIFVISIRLDFLYQYFNTNYLSGWDTATHFGFFRYYSDNIFPGTFDWIDTWFSGIPFPQFYPPLFFYIYSLIDNFIFKIDENIFKVFQLFTYFLTPFFLGALYYFGYKKEKLNATLVIIFSFLISSLSVIITERGFGFAGSIKTGLITQALSFPLLLIWILVTYKIKEKSIYQIISTFLLIVLLLTSIHTTFACILFYTLFFIKDILNSYKENRRINFKTFVDNFKVYFINGFISLLIVSFWYLPMLSYFDFSTARALEYPFGDKNLFMLRQSFQIIIPIFVLFLIRRKKEKHNLIFILSWFSIISYLLNLMDVRDLFTIPVHSERIFGVSFLIFPILLIAFIENFFKDLKIRKIVIMSFAIILIILNVYFKDNMKSYGLFPQNLSIEKLLNESYKYQNKLFLVEPADSKVSIDALINTYLGLHNVRTTYSILRESSISSIFYIGIRNSFSEMPEYWSIRSRLATSPDYLDRDLTLKINDAIKYGITHILVETDKMKNLLLNTKDERVAKVGDYDNWSIFEIKNNSLFENENIEILNYKPVLVFSEFDAKNYNLRSLDYISIVEEMLRVSNFDARFVYANKKDIEKINYADFSFVLLEDKYLTENPEILKQIQNQNTKKKIFIPSQVIKEQKIAKEENLIPYEAPRKANDRASYINFFINFVKENLEKVDQPNLKQVEFREFSKEYQIYNKSEKPAYIIIKRSYFPTWKKETGNIYMINPSFIYTKVDSKTNNIVYFSYPEILFASHYISILGLILFTIYAIVLFVPKRKNN